eukprot:g20295.t1
MLRAIEKDETGSREPGWRAEMGLSESDVTDSDSDGGPNWEAVEAEWENDLMALRRQQLNPRDAFYSGPICPEQCLRFVVKKAGYWNKDDFSLCVFRERTKKDTCADSTKKKQDETKYHFHWVLHFEKKHRRMSSIQEAMDDKMHECQVDVVVPGKGLDARSPPLLYCMLFDGSKHIDSEPVKTANFKVPNQVRIAAAVSRKKLEKRPRNDDEAIKFLRSHVELVHNKTKPEMLAAVETILKGFEEQDTGTCYRIPVRRFQRWVTKVSTNVFGEILDSVEFLLNVNRYRDDLKAFLHEPAKCTCTTSGAKYKVLMDIIELQGHNALEAIGRWVARMDEGTGGRENGMLIMGRTPGTGKSTIACALAHIRILLLNEFRTSIKSLSSSVVLGAAEGDPQMRVDQKSAAPLLFVNKLHQLVPFTVMTSNFWKRNSRWTQQDLSALKSRLTSVLHFTQPLTEIRHKTPATFRCEKRCTACSRKFARACLAGYRADKKKGDTAAAHLNGKPNYLNHELILNYHSDEEDDDYACVDADSSDSDAGAPKKKSRKMGKKR